MRNLYDLYMEPERIKVSQVRAEIADIVGRARYGQHDTIIQDNGKDAAVVISVEKYAELRRLRDAEDLRRVREAIAELDAGHAVTVTPHDLAAMAGLAEVPGSGAA